MQPNIIKYFENRTKPKKMEHRYESTCISMFFNIKVCAV